MRVLVWVPPQTFDRGLLRSSLTPDNKSSLLHAGDSISREPPPTQNPFNVQPCLDGIFQCEWVGRVQELTCRWARPTYSPYQYSKGVGASHLVWLHAHPSNPEQDDWESNPDPANPVLSFPKCPMKDSNLPFTDFKSAASAAGLMGQQLNDGRTRP